MNLKGKNVLLTGGSLGIGKATAALLIEKGANVAISGRNEERLKAAAEELGAYAIAADVSNEADVEGSFEQFIDRFGRLDVLINNAGLARGSGSVFELEMENYEYVFRINVFGTAMMCKHAAKLFRDQNYGDIVNIGSTASLKGYTGGAIYSASKFALRGLSQCLQAELRPFNVRVFQVNPSYVATAFGKTDGVERAEEPNKLSSREIAHTIVSCLEMDRRGYTPEVTIHATNPF